MKCKVRDAAGVEKYNERGARECFEGEKGRREGA